MSAVKVYLFVYNVMAFFGWLYVAGTILQGVYDFYAADGTLTSLFQSSKGQKMATLKIWRKIMLPLTIVQTSALLEIFHSLVGIVRSPVMSVTIQVCSRIFVWYGFNLWCETCHEHFSLVLMALSWSLIELVRYPFYALSTYELKVPNWLFFLRYTLFIVLYPSGISGEILQILTALPSLHRIYPVLERLAPVLLVLYIPLGPYMIFNMFAMRRRAYKNKREKELKELAKNNNELNELEMKKMRGISWPVTNWDTFERSTSVTNKAIWLASIKDVPGVDQKCIENLTNTRNWRFGYAKHVLQNVRLCLKSRDVAVEIATKGLQAAREEFVFMWEGKTMFLPDAMKEISEGFHTCVITGELRGKPEGRKKFGIPYKGGILYGDEAKTQLDKWVNAGTIEDSAAESIKKCLDNPEWMDLSDCYFVLLGATSAMGPLHSLLACGANIVAVDLDRPKIWEGLIKAVRESSGSVIFPISKPLTGIKNDEELFKSAGANLLERTPEIANWLCQCKQIQDRDITIGNYTYLDGALHVQLALACDLIIEKVTQHRTEKSSAKTNLAFLCTPTDVHVIPKAAHDAAAYNYSHAPLWQKAIRSTTNQLKKNVVKPVVDEKGNELYLVDGIVSAQGPNYALAKRLQHWRAVVAQVKYNQTVSSNVAPSTSTKSVVSNSQFAAAYYGFSLFAAMEVMQQETSSAVMLALLVNDLRNKTSVSNAAVTNKLPNPFQLFQFNSFHGGVWRCPYTIDSIGVTAALYYYLNAYKIVVVVIVAVLVGTTNYVIKGHPA